ncbi:MAG: polysaccharide deacetylase family protein [Bacteroidales bacterium]|nr:polysaccharide deacetylase family protein [Bacteroidales bacterium]
MLIFSERITNRLVFTLDFIFNNYLNTSYELTDEKEKFLNYNGAKICYGNENFGDTFFISAENLLFESNIHSFNVTVGEIDGTKVLFLTNDENTDLPFDVFAAIFYLLSRYEEYLYHFDKNEYRFPANESLAYRNNFLNIPIIHIWVEWLAEVLHQKFPELQFKFPCYQFLPSFDVDNAYAYLYKGFWRTVGATARAALLFRLSDYFDRWLTFFGAQKDKYDAYEYIGQIIAENNLQPIWFFLLGDYGKFDKNISHNTQEFRKLISDLSQRFQVGIHPSFASNDNQEQLPVEIHRLEEITGKKVYQSRQHFLRMKLPDTYRNLLDAGIREDYSMGYAEELGFRAGVARPFYFFDLEKNIQTSLKIIPFQVMDVSLRRYKKYSIEESKETTKQLIDVTKQYHGTFVSLWHNESLGTDKYWTGWKSVFEWMVKYAGEE